MKVNEESILAQTEVLARRVEQAVLDGKTADLALTRWEWMMVTGALKCAAESGKMALERPLGGK